MNILAIGDVCGKVGVETLCRILPGLRRLYNISFCVANGENASGVGITSDNAEELFSHGVDVITLGNHTWGQKNVLSYLDDCRYIIRPANFAPGAPGRGWGIFDGGAAEICVINLIGRYKMDEFSDNPFFEIDRLLDKPEIKACKIILVDLHTEATSEKIAMGYYLNGRVSALWGTHTHVQTSDACVLPDGTGYITDLGMTGARDGIIGMNTDDALARFLGIPREKRSLAPPPGKLEGAVFEVDTTTGKCKSVQAIRIE